MMNKAPNTVKAMINPKIPSKLKIVTIIPAQQIPMKMQIKLGTNFIPNKYAATLPVQAPVIGSGIITNKISPNSSYFLISFPFFRVRANSHSKNFLKNAILIKKLTPYFRIKSMNGIGKKFPKIAKRYDFFQPIL